LRGPRLPGNAPARREEIRLLRKQGGREAALAELRYKAYAQRRMTAEQIIDEIKALPQPELERLLKSVRQLAADEIPEDFVEALADFEQGRFVSMETALGAV